jgi:hypothetical protein
MKTCEECLETLIGLHKGPKFDLESSDINFLGSIARQTFKGVGLTDRQYDAVKEKLMTTYKAQFVDNGCDIETAVSVLKLPLRKLDRAKWIRVLDDAYYEEPTIGVRFVFSKKLIAKKENLISNAVHIGYDRIEKVHHFQLTENSIYHIVEEFKDSHFDIEEQLLNQHRKILTIMQNKNDYVPGVYNFNLKNLHQKGVEYVVSSLGEPTPSNLYKFYDRRELLGLSHFDQNDLEQTFKSLLPLTKKLIQREKTHVLVKPQEFTINNLVESVLELYRFPLLIVLDERSAADELFEFNRAFSGVIPNESMTVMFRLDNKDQDALEFNRYIKEHNLNNPVDKSTKIVYINNNKVSKPLLSSNWKPITAITTNSRQNNKVETYLGELDLVMHYDDDVIWRGSQVEKI